MKILKNAALIAALTVIYLQSSAQAPLPINQPDYNKPKIFTDLPERSNLLIANLEALLDFSIGKQVAVTIANNFQLTGTIVSKSDANNASIKSIIISTNRQNATLSFSRITKEDGTITYRGRIIAKNAGDALEFVKDGSNYFIIKKGYYDLVNE